MREIRTLRATWRGLETWRSEYPLSRRASPRPYLGAPGGEIPPGDSTAPDVLHITQNWRGKPLVSRLAVVDLIAATTTKTGLTVQCELDENTYAKGVKVSDEEMDALNIEKDGWHPEWNYTIKPRPADRSGSS